MATAPKGGGGGSAAGRWIERFNPAGRPRLGVPAVAPGRQLPPTRTPDAPRPGPWEVPETRAARPLPDVLLDQAVAGRVIGVVGTSEGTGATFVATMLGVRAALRRRVLCVDAHLRRRRTAGRSLDWLADRKDAVRLLTRIVHRDRSGAELLALADEFPAHDATPVDTLRRLVHLVSLTHERVVVDLGHDLDDLRRAALDACSHIVVVTRPEDVIRGVARDVCDGLVSGRDAGSAGLVINRLRASPGPLRLRGVPGYTTLSLLPESPAHAWWLWQHGTFDGSEDDELTKRLSRLGAWVSGE